MTTEPQLAVLLSLRAHVSLIEESSDRVTLRHAAGETVVNKPGPGVQRALSALAGSGATLDVLGELALASGGFGDLSHLHFYLAQLGDRGLLRRTLLADEVPILAVETMALTSGQPPVQVDAGARYRISRFAHCRRDGDFVVAETPLSAMRTILYGHVGAGILAQLAEPLSTAQLCSRISGLTLEIASAVIAHFLEAGLLFAADSSGAIGEDKSVELRQWEFHDLLFHSRSRGGRHDYPIGATYAFIESLPPAPALKPRMAGQAIRLFRPDIDRLAKEDTTLTSALEERRSIRAYAAQPPSVEQVGEFLFRCARVRSVVQSDPERGTPYETTSRPYPNGGAAYELELYLTVSECVGLSSAIYHYDPLHHELVKLSEQHEKINSLLQGAWLATGGSVAPQVLITLTSRHQRLSWKYSGIAYAITLKNVGALYMTMYLVATAMGLAPCALGTGDSTAVAEAIGLDPLVETAVGEFLIGNMAP